MSWVDYVLLESSYYRGHVIALNEHRSVSSLLPNGLRYWRGGLAKLANIIAPNFAKCAANLGAIAPSGARGVGTLLDCKTLRLFTSGHILEAQPSLLLTSP